MVPTEFSSCKHCRIVAVLSDTRLGERLFRVVLEGTGFSDPARNTVAAKSVRIQNQEAWEI